MEQDRSPTIPKFGENRHPTNSMAKIKCCLWWCLRPAYLIHSREATVITSLTPRLRRNTTTGRIQREPPYRCTVLVLENGRHRRRDI